jgi:hypothetical protein
MSEPMFVERTKQRARRPATRDQRRLHPLTQNRQRIEYASCSFQFVPHRIQNPCPGSVLRARRRSGIMATPRGRIRSTAAMSAASSCGSTQTQESSPSRLCLARRTALMQNHWLPPQPTPHCRDWIGVGDDTETDNRQARAQGTFAVRCGRGACQRVSDPDRPHSVGDEARPANPLRTSRCAGLEDARYDDPRLHGRIADGRTPHPGAIRTATETTVTAAAPTRARRLAWA